MTTNPSPPDPCAWFDDPLEVDRFLDGECDAGEARHRAADVALRPALVRRMASRRVFLAAVRTAGERLAGGAGEATREAHLAALEQRVRAALATPAGQLQLVDRKSVV